MIRFGSGGGGGLSHRIPPLPAGGPQRKEGCPDERGTSKTRDTLVIFKLFGLNVLILSQEVKISQFSNFIS
jgi:hypothetical protein